MKKLRNEVPDVNMVAMPVADFVKYYNENIPESFPRVSLALLEQFRAAHPALFKNETEWSIDKHRKKLMDWLPSCLQ